MVDTIYSKEDYYNALTDILKLSNFGPVEIPARNYWFVRTQGGEFFDEFYFNDYIAIGWDNFPCIAKEDRTEELIQSLKSDECKQPTRVLNHVFNFCTSMKKGDIVIIPSSGSASLAFGQLEEDDYYEYQITDEEKEEEKCPYRRRRKVNWLKSVRKNMIDPKLYSFFRNQQALAVANEYEEFIERAINPFYIKDSIAHLNISVNTLSNPKATDIPRFIINLTDISATWANELNSTFEEPESRINVQSPGVVEFIGNPMCIFILAAAFIAIVGGEFKINVFKTDGLIKTITDAYVKVTAQNAENKLKEAQTKEILHRLNVEDPKNHFD